MPKKTNLKKVETCDLVAELVTRDGVEELPQIGPEGHAKVRLDDHTWKKPVQTFKQDGPAIILIVTD